MPLPSGIAFSNENWNRDQSGKRIEPRDMEGCVYRETSQRDERNVGASSGLHCVGGQGGILAEVSLAAPE